MEKTKVLIAEDEGIIAKDLGNTLEGMGYIVSGMVSSGEEAIQKALEAKPDLVLMDIVLKGETDGVEAADQIRARLNIPVVFLTAYADERTLQRAKITGPYGYLLKPFAERELHSTIEVALYRHEMERKLRKLAAEWETAFNSIQDFISVHDSNFKLIKVNKAFAEAFGRNGEELLGKTCYQVIHGTQEPFPSCPLPHALGSKQAHKEEFFEPRLGIHLEVSASPVFDDKGETTGTVHIAKDISIRKQAEEALRESEEMARRLAQEAAVMSEIGRIISSTLNIEEVYERFAQEAKKLIEFDRICVTIINQKENTVSVPYVWGTPISGRQHEDVFPLTGSATGEVLKTRSSLIIQAEDENEVATRYPGFLPNLQAGLLSTMVIPLISKNEVIAALFFLSKRPNIYTDRDRKMAESIGYQIAGAIANAQIFFERQQTTDALQRSEQGAKRLARENAVMAEIGQIISSTLNIEEVYERFAEKTHKLIPFDRIMINLSDLKNKTSTPAYAAGIDVPGRRVGDITPLAGTVTEEIIRTRSSLLIQVDNDNIDQVVSRFPPLLVTLQAGVRSMIFVPLISKDQVFGVLSFRSFVPKAYTDQNVRLAESIGAQIAGAIANAQLFRERERAEEAVRESEEAAKRLAQENAVMAEIGRIISSTLNVEEVYERFAAEARKLIPFDRIMVALNNLEEGTATVTYASGLEFEGRRIGDVYQIMHSAHEEVLRTRAGLLVQPEAVEELEGRFSNLILTFRAGLRSIMAVPLISRDQVIGALHLRSKKSKAYTDRDLRLAERIANQIAGAVANAKLFAERQKVEVALQTAHRRLEDIIEFLPDATFVVDSDRKVVAWNRAIEELTGVNKKEIIGQGDYAYALPFFGKRRPMLIDFIFPENREAKKLYPNVARKDEKISTEGFAPSALSGKGAFLLGVASPLMDSGGNLTGAIESLRDITDQKQTIARLLQSEKMASIGQLAAGVAHEINNPTGFVSSNLKTLAGYLKDIQALLQQYEGLVTALQEDKEPGAMLASGRTQVERILSFRKEVDIDYILGDISNLIKESQEGTERIKKIVIDLKDFAHPGDDKLKPADINKNLDSTLNVVWNELKYKATVKREYGNIPEVHCYPQQLNQVFVNLLVNAAQAIKEKGEICVRTQTHNGHVEVQISDTGVGIPPENLPKIFDPFFTTKEVGKGTGLGLNVAYNIIKKHNGTIDVKSEVGKGTTFFIHIPINP